MSRLDGFRAHRCSTSIQITSTDPPKQILHHPSSIRFRTILLVSRFWRFLRARSLSLSLSVWPRYSYREEHEGRRSFARKSSLEAIRPPEDGAHQREPNFLPSFIDANILFDSDLLETRHVRRVETTFHGHGKARRVSRETETPPLSLPSADNRISNSRRTNFVELARPFLLNDIVSIFWSCIIRIAWIQTRLMRFWNALEAAILFFLFSEGVASTSCFHVQELELYLRCYNS